MDKSLVAFEEREGQGRYRLLEAVRQYAGKSWGRKTYQIVSKLGTPDMDTAPPVSLS